MADYFPLLERAVSGLEPNTGEARRALYERARGAMLRQLRSSEPPLSEEDITRERLALEEAIRKVEDGAAQRQREAEPVAPAPDEPPAATSNVVEATPSASTDEPASPISAGPSLQEQGLSGFRQVLGEAGVLGGAASAAAQSARDAYGALPGRKDKEPEPTVASTQPEQTPDAEEAVFDPEGSRTIPSDEDIAATSDLPADYRSRAIPVSSEQRSNRRIALVALLLLLAVGLAGVGYWQRDRLTQMFGSTQVATQPPAATRDTSQTPAAGGARPKIADRIGSGNGQTATAPATDVAQKVVLYEEDTAEPQGRRYVGSSSWRTETVSPGPGLAPELAIRADIDIPERKLRMTWSLRRNADRALPASHTIEIVFTVPPDFSEGGIANVPGILMKTAEQTRGQPLAGLAVKVTNGFFLIGLSAVESDIQQNIKLMKERAWFDIPIVYNNGKRAILAVEKGSPGERAFDEAMRAWGQ